MRYYNNYIDLIGGTSANIERSHPLKALEHGEDFVVARTTPVSIAGRNIGDERTSSVSPGRTVAMCSESARFREGRHRRTHRVVRRTQIPFRVRRTWLGSTDVADLKFWTRQWRCGRSVGIRAQHLGDVRSFVAGPDTNFERFSWPDGGDVL